MKKVILILIMVACFVSGGIITATAAEIGQQCTMPQGIHVVQKIMNPFQPFRSVMVPNDQKVMVQEKITEHEMVFLQANMPEWSEEWTDAFTVTFEYDFGGETGKNTLQVLVKNKDLTECKTVE